MTNLTNKVVKIKKTKLVLEFLPHRKTLILSELNLKDSVQTIPIRLNEETSDIVKVPD